MPMYTPSTAAKRLQVSPSSIRNYTTDPRFRPFLSPDATPGEGKSRLLSDADLLVLKFIHNLTHAGLGLDEIARRLAAGELQNATPEGLGVSPEDADEARHMGLQLLPQAFNALQGQLAESQAREQSLVADLLTATATVGELKGQLAAREQEIARLSARLSEREEVERLREAVSRRGWLVRLLGR